MPAVQVDSSMFLAIPFVAAVSFRNSKKIMDNTTIPCRSFGPAAPGRAQVILFSGRTTGPDLLRSFRGDRSLLAISPHGPSGRLCELLCGLPRGRRHLEQSRSAEDLPELPKQPLCALQEYTRRSALSCHSQKMLLDGAAGVLFFCCRENPDTPGQWYRHTAAFTADGANSGNGAEAMRHLPAEWPLGQVYKGSVSADFFIRGRRRFSDLPATDFHYRS